MKLIASDFDQTFTGNFLSENIAAVKRWREAGNLFGIATGRFPDNVDHIYAACGGCDYIVCATGAVVYDGEQRTLIECPSPTKNKLTAIAEIARDCGSKHISAYCPHKHVVCSFENGDEPSVFDGIELFDQISTSIYDREEQKRFYDTVTRDFSDIVKINLNGSAVDMPGLNNGKHMGILRYAELMGVARENIYVIGDNLNDIEMVSYFNGYAVANGVDALKSVASEVVESVAALVDKLL